ncbi:MAG TPA: RNA polymerase sigma factor [Methylomirabilota bacterium]|nr:RNA polymerase sigma factor [Methylomirabilota bacterium]
MSERITTGRDDALEELVERYGERVYRVAMRITGSTEDAEHAAHDALWAAARATDAFADAAALDAWVDRTAARAAYWRLCARRQPVCPVAFKDLVPPLDGDGRHFAPMPDWADEIAENPVDAEREAIVNAALEALPPDYRTAMVLHDLEGWPSLEVAQTLSLCVEEVMARVHCARLFVRKRLSDYFSGARAA